MATGYWPLNTDLPAQDDPFASGVRTTPWLSPADEQKAFHLPPGFEINLVAAEPDIQKPLNMAFDEKGRIWLTNTIEYPYAAPPDRPAKDTIKILEDTDGDGRFEKVTTFADGLNIPMGIYPSKGGCVAFSIPNIWHFEDTDGDGVCDKRTVLYGPFDTSRDTHGMENSFRRGWDGWVYACHGFNNDSRVKGTDGHEIHMQSGNVFRFQLDGSRIEHFTHGQVNPFGMCFDEYFNIFTADCHSKPIYQLLRGGYYPSFGKPHDGLGFVPPMMDHLHGSTAICGLVKYSGENFPEEYRGDFYSGNVMTSRINRNKPEYHGSTIKAIEQPDFLSTTDPWFRPVDLQIGPDGALYIADFYNRIIGHYEVPLPHPGRDRTSGRIWRVSYKGDDTKTKPARMRRFGDKEHGDLFDSGKPFEEGPLPWRLRNMQAVLDQTDSPDFPNGNTLRGVLNVGDPRFQDTEDATAKMLWLWLFENLGVEENNYIADCLRHKSPVVRTQVMKMLSERNNDWGWKEISRILAVTGLEDPDAFVVRAAADALGQHPDVANIKPLIAAHSKAAEDDALLRYGILRSLSYHIGAINDIADYRSLKLDDNAEKLVASTCLAVPTSISAAILLRYLETHDDNVAAYLQHAARYADPAAISDIIRIGRSKAASDLEFQASVIESLASGLDQRGGMKLPDLASWARDVATRLLADNGADRIAWTAVPIDGLPSSENPWVVTPRTSRDGDKESLFFSSLPRGEQRTGIYRSAPFDLPERLTFWCSGHSGRPPAQRNDCNYIRLREAKTHEILAESRPPRNDTARQITWDLSKHVEREGEAPAEPRHKANPRRGFIELIDGDTANAYAWLAVGRFSLSALNPSDAPHKQQLAAEIIGKLKLESLKPQLTSLVAAPNTDSNARTAIAQALLAFDPDARASTLAAALADAQLPDDLRPKIGTGLATRDGTTLLDALREVLKRSPLRLQTSLAQTLVSDAA
ncbi:MAG TPA: PVC-type heme-binding CxxCH protein, partial [Pirellulaceae bacterium]